MDDTLIVKRPLKLEYTRIHRKYTGGFLLEQWQGNADATDGNRPEEWVASTVEARTTEYIRDEGLSRVCLADGSKPLLRDIINSDPAGFLGEGHLRKFGTDTALLVKVIDSCNRLYLQVHPDKNYAKTVFGSDFGKTEAWYILGGRTLKGQKPYILLGFKKGITKELWKKMFEQQDVQGMENALHRFAIKPGDIYFVESGVPHALGSGCFLLEVQESTDYTMRVERFTPEGDPLPNSFCHQGVGFEKMFECFHYDTYTREEILEKWYLKPSVIDEQGGGTLSSLISPAFSSCFSMDRLEVSETFYCKSGGTFSVSVVTKGCGKIIWDNGEMEINQADELFLPAGLGDIFWHNCFDDPLEIILCHPPR